MTLTDSAFYKRSIITVLTYIGLFAGYLLLAKFIWLLPFVPIIVGLAIFPGIYGVIAAAVPIILGVGLVFIYYKRVRGVNVFKYFKLISLPESRTNFNIAAGCVVVYLVITFSLNSTYSASRVVFLAQSGHLFTFFTAALWEEIVLRGIILTQLIARLGFTRANILTTLVFVAGHYFLQGGPESGTWGSLYGLDAFSLFARCALGYATGYVAYKSNSVWLGSILHWGHNLFL